MRCPRLRDTDGTEYDPETGEKALLGAQLSAAESRVLQMLEFSASVLNNDDVGDDDA